MKILLYSFALDAVAFASGLSLHAQFTGFKNKHGKKYNNASEEVSLVDLLHLNKRFYFTVVIFFNYLKQLCIVKAYRKGVFASNIAKINQHNNERSRIGHTWTMAVNQFADLTHDEFMAMQTLKVKDLPKTTEKYQMKAPAVASRVDWRDKV